LGYDPLTYAPIVHIKPDGSFAPALATSWHYFKTKAGPNKAFEFTLRHNARFSNGTPVTAAAVVTWFNFFYASKVAGSGSFGPNPRFQAVGKWTVRMYLSVPNATVPFYLSEPSTGWSFVSAPEAVANPNLFSNDTYGAGPYHIDYSKSVLGDHLTLLPNPYYYDQKAIKWSEIDVKLVSVASSRLQAHLAGQFDVSTGDPTTVDAAKAAGLHVVSAPTSILIMPLWDFQGQSTPALHDVRVRQALNYAVNRTADCKALAGDYGTPTSANQPEGLGRDPKLDSYYPYNPTKAKALLAQAGATGFTLKILAFPGPHTLIARALAADFDAVGVNAVVYSATGVTDWVNARASHQYPAWTSPELRGPMPYLWTRYLSPTGEMMPFGESDPTISTLYFKGAASSNPGKYWKQMNAAIVKSALFVPVCATRGFNYVSNNVGGVVASDNRVVATNAAEWFPK
jgi:peptide/nickel transport system substrate-binding protein